MKRKLLVTDVDGTLLHDKTGLSQEVISIANKYVEKGNLLALCTGRSLEGVRMVAEILPVNVPCPLLTGAMLYDFRKLSVTSAFPLDPLIFEVVSELMDDCPDIAVQFFCPHHTATIRSNAIFRIKGVSAEQQEKTTPLPEAVKGNVCKILIVHQNRDILLYCKERIDAIGSNKQEDRSFRCDFASRHFMEIVSGCAGKKNAIITLSRLLSIPLEEICVAGDGLTDLPMFRIAGMSFAPEDAIEDVKKAATFRFPSAKDHGIIEVFRYLTNEL